MKRTRFSKCKSCSFAWLRQSARRRSRASTASRVRLSHASRRCCFCAVSSSNAFRFSRADSFTVFGATVGLDGIDCASARLVPKMLTMTANPTTRASVRANRFFMDGLPIIKRRVQRPRAERTLFSSNSRDRIYSTASKRKTMPPMPKGPGGVRNESTNERNLSSLSLPQGE